MSALVVLSGLSFCLAAPRGIEGRTLKLGVVPRPEDATADVGGLSFGLLADRTARVRGLQLALVFAQTDEAVRGAQVALGVNFADRTFAGAQVAGGANFAADGRGIQLAVGINFADRLRGVQLAIVNDATDGRGVQLGLFNKGARVEGVRFGLTNRAEEVRGFQAAIFNGTDITEGVQVAAVNVAADASGVGIGVVNVARRTRGLQVGVVNISERDEGESLGVLNLVKDGIHGLALYATDTMLANLGVKLGGRHLYTALLAEYHPGEDVAPGALALQRSSRRFGFGIGVGWRQTVATGRMEALEIEASGTGLHARLEQGWRDAPVLWSLRMGVILRLFERVGLLAGVAANAVVGTGGRDADIGLGLAELLVRAGDATVRLYPGAFVGLQL